jgi:hypothetical protein
MALTLNEKLHILGRIEYDTRYEDYNHIFRLPINYPHPSHLRSLGLSSLNEAYNEAYCVARINQLNAASARNPTLFSVPCPSFLIAAILNADDELITLITESRSSYQVEERIWLAAKAGDIDAMKALQTTPDFNVNFCRKPSKPWYVNMVERHSPVTLAAKYNRNEFVNFLLEQEKTDLCLHLYEAYCLKYTNLVSKILANERISHHSNRLLNKAIIRCQDAEYIEKLLNLKNIDLLNVRASDRTIFDGCTIMYIAKSLLSDMFDDNPRRPTLIKCIELLRKAHVRQFCRDALTLGSSELEALKAAHKDATMTKKEIVECFITMAKSDEDEIGLLEKAVEKNAEQKNALFAFFHQSEKSVYSFIQWSKGNHNEAIGAITKRIELVKAKSSEDKADIELKPMAINK